MKLKEKEQIETTEEEKVWYRPHNIFQKFETEEEAREAGEKLNAEQQVTSKVYVRKWQMPKDIDPNNEHNFTEEEKQEVADHINEHGFCSDPWEPTPALAKYFGVEHKGYYYFPDMNHAGWMLVTEEGAKKYGLYVDEDMRLEEIWSGDEEHIDDLNEDQPKDNPFVYHVYIEQYWSVYDNNGIFIDPDNWKDLPPDLEPYEDEFVLGINEIPQALVDDEEHCQIMGWCDG